MSRDHTVKITKVEIEAPGEGLSGAHIDHPVAGSTSDTYAIEVRGWAIGTDEPVEAIEVSLGARRTALKASLGEPRPDVAGEFPDAPHAQGSGFRTLVGVLENRAKFGLEVHAQLSNGSRVRIGRIEGEREPIRAQFEPTIQPLMLNTIGRSGSTWLAWVLSCHPEVVGYRPMQFETRVATYWTSIFQGLAQPRSYLSQLVTTDLESDRRWWLGDGARSTPKIEDPQLEAWLGGEAVEAVATMCLARIDAFFRQLSVERGKPEASFFLEKFLLEPVILDLLAELYGGAREIILVRDFRDVASSVLAFNRKRGYLAFGREHVDSDVEYVHSVALRQALGVKQRWEEQGSDAHLIRYEDLLTEPEPTLERLFAFVGVDSSAGVVKRTLERAESDAPSMDHHRTATDPAATIGRWREDLSEELISACAESLDPVLEAFGYEPTRASAAAGSDT
ncbi:MAG: sulfotransferase [Solirubrobacterales bacterium]